MRGKIHFLVGHLSHVIKMIKIKRVFRKSRMKRRDEERECEGSEEREGETQGGVGHQDD